MAIIIVNHHTLEVAQHDEKQAKRTALILGLVW